MSAEPHTMEEWIERVRWLADRRSTYRQRLSETEGEMDKAWTEIRLLEMEEARTRQSTNEEG